MANKKEEFSFELSLSVLNHLGRNLYRSFITVIGEAISNSWDADAENVWIDIDKANNYFVVKDDGDGMNRRDFQEKFLRIGYSKRRHGKSTTKKGRPFIGRKGIGKLALLSCAKKISILTRKQRSSRYVGGVIDNTELDKAIKSDVTPDKYRLEKPDHQLFRKYIDGHEKGTIIHFEGLNEGIRNNTDYLKKLVALYFRFSLLDESFNIYINDDPIGLTHLADLARKTQFLWRVNAIDDPYISGLPDLKKPIKDLPSLLPIKGFVGSVEKPRNLKVASTEERIGVDLFVNGRLREKDILKHIPTARIVESYLYGQIHFDSLDETRIDRFTSSREGIVADDPKYKEMLETLRSTLLQTVLEDWDIWRVDIAEDGDSDNPRMTKKERKSRELFTAVSVDYSLPEESVHQKKVKDWVNALAEDAQFNFSSYAECFISENLLRKYIQEQGISLSSGVAAEVARLRQREIESKASGNLNIDLRQNDHDLSYLEMAILAKMVDPQRGTTNTLDIDAREYKPIRDALAHTALLTSVAKGKLASVYENVKARVRALLSSP